MAFFLLISINCVSAAQDKLDQKTLYALSRQCGKQAEEHFENCPGGCQDYARNAKGEAVRSYRSHFNSKLYKCFILESLSISEFQDANGVKLEKPVRFTNEQLEDVNENKVYGWGWFYEGIDAVMPPISCIETELNKECHSRSEWEAFIKPYMEE